MKPVLLLVPGMLNTARIWHRVVPLLADAAELRIADVSRQTSIAAMAQDAWALLADVPATTPVALCGFSMGGYVAIEMLAVAPPREVAALALLDSSGRPETPEGAMQREKTIAALGRDFEKVIAGVAHFATHASTHDNAALIDEVRTILRDTGAEAGIRQNRAILARGDHRARLAQWRRPTLVACGRSDQVTPGALSEELAALIPGATLAWIEDAGHMTPLEQPARVAQLLRALLAPLS